MRTHGCAVSSQHYRLYETVSVMPSCSFLVSTGFRRLGTTQNGYIYIYILVPCVSLCDCLSLKGKENVGALPVDTFTWREAKKQVREWGTSRSPTGVLKFVIRLRLLDYLTLCFLYVCTKHFFIEDISVSRMCFANRFVQGLLCRNEFSSQEVVNKCS